MNYELRALLRLSTTIILVVSALHIAAAGEQKTARVLPQGASVAALESTNRIAQAQSTNGVSSMALPPLPEGVKELKFGDFYKKPIGPFGLEFTDKLRGAVGQRVRILGYMVRREQAPPNSFLLTAFPITLHEDEYGFCEDMPATVLTVITAPKTPANVPFTPGLLLLTGKLEVGNRAEADGRISTVRLQLDPPNAEQEQKIQAFAALNASATSLTNTPAKAGQHQHNH